WQLFGNAAEVGGEETDIPLKVIGLLSNDDIIGTAPHAGRPYHPIITDSLTNAIRRFILCAANRRHSNPNAWVTMLVHTSGRIEHQQRLYQVINNYIQQQLMMDWDENRAEWINLWENEITSVNVYDFSHAFPHYGEPSPSDYL